MHGLKHRSVTRRPLVTIGPSARVAAFLLPCVLCASTVAGDKTLYDEDGRVEVFQAPPALQEVARAVVAVFPAAAVDAGAGYVARLPARPTGRDRNWCPAERFIDQPTTAVCSGFLIAPDLVATSAHCIKPPEDAGADGLACADARFVFGYRVDRSGEVDLGLDGSQVYRCRRVVGGDSFPRREDWRVVQLDRAVQRRPLPVVDGDVVTGAMAVAVVGHPSGLPAKVGTGGQVRKTTRDGYFVTDLDTYEGNSGSPVVARVGDGYAVVGLVSRGSADYVPVGGAAACQQSNRCLDGACAGEHVTLSSYLAPYATYVVEPLVD